MFFSVKCSRLINTNNLFQEHTIKLAILSRGPKSYSTRRFKEAALQRGHQVDVLDTLKFAIDLQEGIPDLYFRQ